jgi:hypothetical protein
MIKTVAKKVVARILWMARGTATMVGLAVMLALTVGLASTALAGTGVGAPFHLGKINTVDAVSTLVGEVSGPTLSVENDASNRAATALNLRMDNPNLAPMRTNATGTVVNFNADAVDGRDASSFAEGTDGKANDADKLDGLDSSSYLKTFGKAADADRLDGKDSTSFASATNGKANDADRLDGKDSSAFVSSISGTAPNANNLDGQDSTRFFSGKTYSVENSSLGPGDGSITSRIALCDEGDNVLGGGGGSFADEPILDSFPLGSRSWFVSMRDDSGPSEIRATALCADFPPLR